MLAWADESYMDELCMDNAPPRKQREWGSARVKGTQDNPVYRTAQRTGPGEGGALLVIMTITGPRETNDYRVRNPEYQVNPNPPLRKKKGREPKGGGGT